MKVIAENKKVCSTLHGDISLSPHGILFTFRVLFYSGSRYHGNLTFRDLPEVIDYLLDDCGFDLVTFKNK